MYENAATGSSKVTELNYIKTNLSEKFEKIKRYEWSVMRNDGVLEGGPFDSKLEAVKLLASLYHQKQIIRKEYKEFERSNQTSGMNDPWFAWKIGTYFNPAWERREWKIVFRMVTDWVCND